MGRWSVKNACAADTTRLQDSHRVGAIRPDSDEGDCTCNNRCYGHESCTCNFTCNVGYNGCTCYSTVAAYAGGCTCNNKMYGADDITEDMYEDCTSDAISANPLQIAGVLYMTYPSGGNSYMISSSPLAIESDEFDDYSVAMTVNTKTGDPFLMSEMSAISAIGYAIVPTSDVICGQIGAGSQAYATSAFISEAYVSIGYVAPRPILGYHVYSNNERIQSSFRPIRMTGHTAFWKADFAYGNAVGESDFERDANYEDWNLTSDGSQGTKWASTSNMNNATTKKVGLKFSTYPESGVCERYDIMCWGKKAAPTSWSLSAFNKTSGKYEEIDARSRYGSTESTAAIDAKWSFKKQTKSFTFTNTICACKYALLIHRIQNDSAGTRPAKITEFRMYEEEEGSSASDDPTYQSLNSMGVHYLSAGSFVYAVPSITMLNDSIVMNCPSGNYLAIARLQAQGIL